ncbi:MAG: ABC transporter ATP-binding protein [Lactobacillales bacterium]|nr:ABC transporter ATP-binding protein [Lactobacillales bacterium]
MQNTLELKNISKKYKGSDFAIKDVSFNIPTGYITGFIGPNGAGKTTTIRTILGLLATDAGEIVKPEVDEIGVVLDAPMFPGGFTCLDVEKASKMFYPKWDGAEYRRLLKMWNIDLNKSIDDLSRGMAVKLQVASCLARDTKLLLLDEPTSGLDPVSRDEICELLLEVIQDESRSVMFSTHITSDLEKVADFIVFIIGGEIVFTGTREDLEEKFFMVKGSLEELQPEYKLIGVRKHKFGFEGIVDAEDLDGLASGLTVEPATLDEIIIFTERDNKGE